MVEKYYYVYLLSSGRNGTLYVGVTNNLVRRVAEHKAGLADSFTKRYHIDQLMWFEVHTSIDAAIQREKRIKKWDRDWKIDLFRETNPQWIDLYPGLVKGIWTSPSSLPPLGCHPRESGEPTLTELVAAWFPAFAGMTSEFWGEFGTFYPQRPRFEA